MKAGRCDPVVIGTKRTSLALAALGRNVGRLVLQTLT